MKWAGPVLMFFSTSMYSADASAQTSMDLGDKAVRGYALWTCAALGGLAGKDTADLLPFFENGHDLLSDTVAGIIEGRLTENEANKVPVGITWSLGGGPSLDFRLGVVWANIQNYQYDETFPSPSDATFEEQKNIQAVTAETNFLSSNCQLLLPK